MCTILLNEGMLALLILSLLLAHRLPKIFCGFRVLMTVEELTG
jgi:hypothetical protein